jgi:hypothetical protein
VIVGEAIAIRCGEPGAGSFATEMVREDRERDSR